MDKDHCHQRIAWAAQAPIQARSSPEVLDDPHSFQEYAGEDTALQVNLGSASAQAAVEFFILAQDVIHRCSDVIILGGKEIGYHCTCQLFG
jgi:hypothetical protein